MYCVPINDPAINNTFVNILSTPSCTFGSGQNMRHTFSFDWFIFKLKILASFFADLCKLTALQWFYCKINNFRFNISIINIKICVQHIIGVIIIDIIVATVFSVMALTEQCLKGFFLSGEINL